VAGNTSKRIAREVPRMNKPPHEMVKLREQLEEAQEEIKQLKNLLFGSSDALRKALGMRKWLSDVLSILMSGRHYSANQLAELYGYDKTASNIFPALCHLRKQGIKIKKIGTHNGFYYIDKEEIDRLKALTKPFLPSG
jgi:hypothetical protein